MKMGISRKLIGAQVFGLVLFIFLAAFSYVSLSSYSFLQERDIELAYKIELVSDLQLLLDEMLMPPNDYLITGDKKERENFAALVTKAASLFEKIKSSGSSTRDEISISTEVEKEIIELEQRAMVLLSTEKPVGNMDAAKLMKELDASGQIVENQVEKFHGLIKSEMESHRKRASGINARTIWTFLSLTAVFLSGIISMILVIRKGVTKPISELTDAVKVIGRGNLDLQINIKTGDEIEVLGREFNGMARSLKEKITEVREFSARLEKTSRQLDQNILQFYTLYNISKAISATFETEKLLNQIVSEVGNSLQIHKINIMLIDSSRNELYIAAGLGVSENAMGVRFKLKEGIYGWAGLTGQAEIINDPAQNKRFKATEGLDDNVSSMIIAPFKGRGEVIGILNAYKLGGDFFDESAFDLLTAAASQIGMTLENARLFEETRTLAITDGMTGLYNHRYFLESLGNEFERAKRYKRPLSLLMIDVDFFKNYNDAHGHPKGDEVLKAVAGILKKSVRKSDFVARYGGEEFAVILPETERPMALALAERIRKEVESTGFPGGETQPLGKISISIGTATTVDGITKGIEELIKAADNRLYQAKEQGRNRVC